MPTLDQERPEATYKDWNSTNTVIKVYRIDTDVYPGTWAKTRESAAADCRAKHGRILEANFVPSRAFFRVWRRV